MPKTPSGPKTNASGIVSPALGIENYSRLEALAEKHGRKPTTLARQLLLFAIEELERGKIVLPPEQAIRI